MRPKSFSSLDFDCHHQQTRRERILAEIRKRQEWEDRASPKNAAVAFLSPSPSRQKHRSRSAIAN